ncbi:MAG: autotransporter domain-containing protein [Planctomycetota bacterium]|nr:autotransporter domain-containing protein [Planctomycetota bacterium]
MLRRVLAGIFICVFAASAVTSALAVDYEDSTVVNATTDWPIGADVKVTPTASSSGDIVVQVTQGSNAMGSLTLESKNLPYSQNVSIIFDGSVDAVGITFTGATLAGDAGLNATLGLSAATNDVTLTVTGSTTLDGNATVSMGGGIASTLTTGSLVLQGIDSTMSNTVTIGANSVLKSGSLSMAGSTTNTVDVSGVLELTDAATASTISSGTLTVDATGAVRLNKLEVSGTGNALNLAGGAIEFHGADAQITLESGSAMTVSSSSTITGEGTVANTGGVLNINANLDADDTTFESYGTTTVAAGAGLTTTKKIDINAGEFNVNGTAQTDGYNQSGGVATVAGTLDAGTSVFLANSILHVNADGTMDVGDMALKTGVFTQTASTTTTNVWDGGKLNVGSTIAMGGGNFNVNGEVNTNVFTQTAGTTTIDQDGALDATTSVAIGGSNFNVNGDVATDMFAQTAGDTVISGTGTIEAATRFTVGGGSFRLDRDGTLITQTFIQSGGTVTISTGGLLTVDDEISVSGVLGVLFDLYNETTTPKFTQTGGTANINDGAILDATTSVAIGGGNFNVKGEVNTNVFTQTAGTTTIDQDGALDATTSVAIGGGNFNVKGEVNTNVFTQTAGTTMIDQVGVLDATTSIALDGGHFVAGSGGTATTNVFTQNRGETTIQGGGLIAAEEYSLNGGTLDVRFGGILNLTQTDDPEDEQNQGDWQGLLNVRGGTMDVAGNIYSRAMTFSGGVINMRETGNLWIKSAVNGASGTLNMHGGNAIFEDNVIFESGSVVSHNSVSSIFGNLNMRRNSTLDVSAASLDVIGDLTLAGAYRAGFDPVTGENTRANVNNLHVEKTADIEITTDLLRSILNDGDNRILASKTSTGPNDVGSFMHGAYVFGVKGDDLGLYVVNARQVSTNEMMAYMHDEWNRHSMVRGHAYNLIKRDFVENIVDASKIYMDPALYDALSYDGRENIRNLFNIGAGPDESSYSALMLYNGSGLATANRAHIDSAAQQLTALGERMGVMRHEIRAANDEMCEPGRFVVPADNYKNRFWATGFGSGITEDWEDGFAGYKYNPRGMAVGYDRIFGDMAAGAAFSYGYGRFEDKAAEKHDSDIATYTMSLYGLYAHESGLYASASAGYTFYDNSIRDMRTVALYGERMSGWNKADYNAHGWQIAGALGYDVEAFEDFLLTPSIGIRHITAESDSHNQRFQPVDGREYTTLRAGKVRNHSTAVPIELAVNYNVMNQDMGMLSLSGMIGYAYEFHNKGATGYIAYGGLAFPPVKVASKAPGKNILSAGFGLNYVYDRFEFGLGYKFTSRSEYASHDYNGSFSVMF